MRLHSRTVDEHLRWWPACVRERMEEIDPNALGSPADETVVERLVRAIEARRIDPTSTRLQHVNDAADHPAIMDPRLASRVARQMRFDLRELLVRQPEAVPIHRALHRERES
jgi:hypothetical protein